jgi:cell division protein FtsB
MSDFVAWATHGVKRGRFEMNRRTLTYAAALALSLTLAAALYLMLVSQTAARGRHIQQLQAELYQLQRENHQLEVEIARKGSVKALRERALEMGFGPAERVEFFSTTID